MLVRLMYASRATEPVKPETLDSIMRQSTVNNAKVGVSGVLCVSGAVYLQVLEGGRAQVSELYNRLSRDPRHFNVTLLSFDEIDERSFAGWTMGMVDAASLNPAVLMRFSETASLDPYRLPAKASRALFDELIATASVVRPH